MKSVKSLLAAIPLMALAIDAHAYVSSQEAARLGTSLTSVGAEKAGNADGSIPPYSGGLTIAPSSFKAGDSMRPDPFAHEKPLLVINGKNVDCVQRHADRHHPGVGPTLPRFSRRRVSDPPHRIAAPGGPGQ